MLTSIDDIKHGSDNSEKRKLQSSLKEKNNVLSFKSLKTLENESRKKAIEAITKRAEQLHW